MISRFKLSIIILPLFFSSCADALSGTSEKERQLFQQIKVGMKKEEVEKILGYPDRRDIDSSSNNTLYYYYFTKNKSALRSTLPTVIFDSSGVVKFSTYGDGG